MTVTAEDVVVNLLKLNGDKLKGQTRLQREAYLLDSYGAQFGLSFVYHHYGPYSFELVDGWTEAQAKKRIKIAEKSGRYGVYSIFELNESKHKKEESGDLKKLGELSADTASSLLAAMTNASDMVLELAAAIVYLKQRGYATRSIEELKLRKPLEATEGRIKKAEALLASLKCATAPKTPTRR